MAHLVLIQKPGRPLKYPKSYEPLWLLSTARTAFEALITNRLIAELEHRGGYQGTRTVSEKDDRPSPPTSDGNCRVRRTEVLMEPGHLAGGPKRRQEGFLLNELERSSERTRNEGRLHSSRRIITRYFTERTFQHEVDRAEAHNARS